MMTNEHGFSLVSFSIVLPLILFIVLSLLFSTSLLFRHRQNQHVCQKEVLQLQSQQSHHLRQLLSLNKKAQNLRRQRKIANKVLNKALQSGQPKAIIAAKALQWAIKSQQLILRNKQTTIITQAKKNMAQSLKRIKHNYSKNQVFTTVQNHPLSLPVIPQGITSESPTYHPRPNIEKWQIVALSWSWPLPKPWQRWVNYMNIKSKKLTGQCAGTLRKRNRQWREELAAYH